MTARSKRQRTICLNMIVKDEARIIRRCLDTVMQLIGYWVIVDTGSTDGTQDIIREHLKDIPGELHERHWKDFGHNRTEALELAKGKAVYTLVIDADEMLIAEPGFETPPLTADAYQTLHQVGDSGTSFYLTNIVRDSARLALCRRITRGHYLRFPAGNRTARGDRRKGLVRRRQEPRPQEEI